MKEKLTRERWIGLTMLLLINLVSVTASAFHLHAVPVWVHVLNVCLLCIGIFFAVLGTRKESKRRTSLGAK